MVSFLIDGCELVESDGVFTLKNLNTTIGFVRFNKSGEVEYIFVNPIFRKKGIAKKLLKLVKGKTKKKIIFQTPISPLGSKLLKSFKTLFTELFLLELLFQIPDLLSNEQLGKSKINIKKSNFFIQINKIFNQ